MAGGAANQTRQITIHPLTNSTLQALALLYIIYRVSGDATRAVLAPDIAIPDEPQKPRAMIERLLTRLETAPRQTGQ